VSERERLRRIYEAKVLAELTAATAAEPVEPRGDRSWSGDPLARTMLVKGEPGPAERAGGEVLSGEDGDAARKALAALGLLEHGLFATLSRPAASDPQARVSRLLRQVEAVDPRVLVALDATAAEDVAAALGIRLEVGRPQHHRGRVVLAVDDFAASLADEDRKRRVWLQLRTLGGQASGPR